MTAAAVRGTERKVEKNRWGSGVPSLQGKCRFDSPLFEHIKMQANSSRPSCNMRSAVSSRRSIAVASRRCRPISTKAAQVEAPSAVSTQYYALLANANFMLNDVQNESMAEQLRERVRFFKVDKIRFLASCISLTYHSHSIRKLAKRLTFGLSLSPSGWMPSLPVRPRRSEGPALPSSPLMRCGSLS